MTRLERLEKEIAELSHEELEQLRAWFHEFDAEQWDREILRDSESGSLRTLKDEALADHRSGRSKRL
jgi:hypothetical protein